MNQEKDPQTSAAEEEKAAAEETKPEETEAEAEAEEPAQTAPEKTEEAKSSADKKKKGKKDGPSFFESEKFKHGSTATAFTAIFIAVIVLLNVFVGMLSDKYPSMNFDVTKAGNNSLSSDALSVIDKVKTKVDITICASKQACEANSVTSSTSSSVDYAQVSRLFSEAAERNSNISLSYVDLDKQPMFAAEYKSDNIAAGDIVVKSDKRHRVLTSSDLFKTSYSSDYSSSTTTSNVDSSLASSLNSVISETMPIASFDTAHSEQMSTDGYKHLLENNSFETKTFNLLTDKIPDNTQLLVLGCPTSDLTDGEVAKIDAFLSNKSSTLSRSLLVTTSAGASSLAKLGSYLNEWGLSADTSAAIEETNQQKYVQTPLAIYTEVQSSLSLGGSSSTYAGVLAPNTAPVSFKSDSVANRKIYALIKSSATSVLLKTSGNSTTTSDQAAQTVAALSQQSITVGGKTVHASVILSGSTTMFDSSLLSTSVVGNMQYLGDLSRYATGTNNTATQISSTSKELYAQDISVTSQMISLLGYGVFTILIPLIVMIAGIIVYRKRRAL